jgi:hypothetical protein
MQRDLLQGFDIWKVPIMGKRGICGVPNCRNTPTVASATNPLMVTNRIRVCQEHAEEIDRIDDKSREAYFGWGNFIAADRPRLVRWDVTGAKKGGVTGG